MGIHFARCQRSKSRGKLSRIEVREGLDVGFRETGYIDIQAAFACNGLLECSVPR